MKFKLKASHTFKKKKIEGTYLVKEITVGCGEKIQHKKSSDQYQVFALTQPQVTWLNSEIAR